MRAFVGTLIVLAVLAVAGDAALTRVAEQRASEQASVLLGAPATVDLEGWPVSLRLLLGSVPAVDVLATDVSTPNGARLDRLEVTLSDVRLRLTDLFTGRLRASARSGTFVADLDATAVEQLLGMLGQVGDVALSDGVVRLEVAGRSIDATVAVEGRTLVLRAGNPVRGRPVRLQVPLPTLPAGTTVEQVTVLPGILRVEGAFVPSALG